MNPTTQVVIAHNSETRGRRRLSVLIFIESSMVYQDLNVRGVSGAVWLSCVHACRDGRIDDE